MGRLTAGELNRRITLYERAPRLDSQGTGEDVGLWRELPNDPKPYAKAVPLGGGESQEASQVVARQSFKFTVWWRADVHDRGVEMAVVYEGKAYDVAAVEEVGDREGLALTANGRAEGLQLAPVAAG